MNKFNIKEYEEKIHGWIPLDKELRIVNVETPFEEKILHKIASNREPGTGFMEFSNPHKAILLANENEFVGCIVWFKGRYARLNWIFIRKEYRRKGYGTKLLKGWVEKIADKINDKYVVESPNKAFASLLFKIGHLKIEDEEIIEAKCFIIASPGWSPDMMFYDF